MRDVGFVAGFPLERLVPRQSGGCQAHLRNGRPSPASRRNDDAVSPVTHVRNPGRLVAEPVGKTGKDVTPFNNV